MHVMGVYEHVYGVDIDSLEECYMLAYSGFHIRCLIFRDALGLPQLSLRSSAPVAILVQGLKLHHKHSSLPAFNGPSEFHDTVY